jgi:hypothetical protein
MGKLTVAERGRAATLRAKVTLLPADLDCWHLLTT